MCFLNCFFLHCPICSFVLAFMATVQTANADASTWHMQPCTHAPCSSCMHSNLSWSGCFTVLTVRISAKDGSTVRKDGWTDRQTDRQTDRRAETDPSPAYDTLRPWAVLPSHRPIWLPLGHSAHSVPFSPGLSSKQTLSLGLTGTARRPLHNACLRSREWEQGGLLFYESITTATAGFTIQENNNRQQRDEWHSVTVWISHVECSPITPVT